MLQINIELLPKHRRLLLRQRYHIAVCHLDIIALDGFDVEKIHTEAFVGLAESIRLHHFCNLTHFTAQIKGAPLGSHAYPAFCVLEIKNIPCIEPHNSFLCLKLKK